ncbi:ABC transporter permease, partial [Nonomuraea sp. NPDC059022]
MWRYLLRRLGQALLVVAGVVTLTFVIMRLVPGEAAGGGGGAPCPPAGTGGGPARRGGGDPPR